jgi:hypothetical protein
MSLTAQDVLTFLVGLQKKGVDLDSLEFQMAMEGVFGSANFINYYPENSTVMVEE